MYNKQAQQQTVNLQKNHHHHHHLHFITRSQ